MFEYFLKKITAQKALQSLISTIHVPFVQKNGENYQGKMKNDVVHRHHSPQKLQPLGAPNEHLLNTTQYNVISNKKQGHNNNNDNNKNNNNNNNNNNINYKLG